MAAVAALVLLTTGCVSVNKSVLSETRLAQPVPQQQVQVYFADDSIPDHERIAILNAKGSDDWTNEGQMIDKLREAAGKLGANAIILNQMAGPGTGERVVAALFGGDAQRRGSAIAIYIPPTEGRSSWP
jgi:hypothetical protein